MQAGHVIIYANWAARFTHTKNIWRAETINAAGDAVKCVQEDSEHPELVNNSPVRLTGSFLHLLRAQQDGVTTSKNNGGFKAFAEAQIRQLGERGEEKQRLL